MAEFENPSAGKFGPPPENAQRERARAGGAAKARKSIAPLMVVLVIYALQYYVRSNRGWGGALAVILGIAAYVVEQIFHHQEQEASGGPDPYTQPTHITR